MAALFCPAEETVDHVAKVPIWTGDERVVAELSPSRPLPLLPHAQSVPSVLIAAVWMPADPIESDDHVASVPIWTGDERALPRLSPSSPNEFLPQAQSVPSVFSATV